MSKPWFLPETADEAADAIENIAAMTDFLKDTITESNQVRLSERGVFGLYCTLDFMSAVLRKANAVPVKE